MRKRYTDLTQGKVLPTLIRFAVPVLLSNLLQQLYSAADTVVVGKFSDKTALAAVGSTGAVTTLILNLFLGLSVGANVVVATYHGAGEHERKRRAMDTSIIIAAIGGLFLTVFGLIFARSILHLMGSPDSVIDQAALYMRIYFLGVPFSLLYNFGSGILRAHGDTKRPMYILSASGLVNVLLNLLLVIKFHLSVAGVAIATVTSQVLSSLCVLFILFHPRDAFAMRVKKMKFDKKEFFAISRVGIPAGLNGITFSLANVVVQSATNSFGDTVIAANSAANSLDAFIYLCLTAFTTAAVSFVGQNFGAKKYRRIDRGVMVGTLCSAVCSLFVASMFNLFPNFFLGLYSDDPEVIALAARKLLIIGMGYSIYSLSEQATAATRGMGDSTRPFIVNLVCICGTRLLWIFTVFQFFRTPDVLYACYPVSWVFSTTAMFLSFLHCRKKHYEFPLPPEEGDAGVDCEVKV